MAVLWKHFLGNSNTIYDSCKVLCPILFCLGCSGIIKQKDHFKYNCKSLLYTWLAVFWFIGSLIGCMYIKLQDPRIAKLDNLIKTIIYLEMTMSVFMYLVTVTSMLYNIRIHLELYQRLNDLDQELIRRFGCNLNYDKLTKKHFILITSVVIIYFTVITAAVSQASHGHEFIVNLLVGLAYTALTGGPHLTGYSHMNMAEILRIRFRLLQKLLQRKHVCSSHLSELQQIDCLRFLIRMVEEYHNCIRTINSLYSLGLVSTTLHDFTLTTSEFYLIFDSRTLNSTESSLIIYVAICMLLPVYKIIIAPIYCEKSIKDGLKCFKIIKDSDLWFPGNTEVRQMVSTCLLLHWENKMHFLCGSMILNKQIIALVCSQIFNYLLILIQFRMTQEMGNEIEKQKNTIQEWIGVDYV